MSCSDPWPGDGRRSGLLIDTQLLVLFIVGSVNRERIGSFKRTSKYKRSDYELLLRVIEQFPQLYTLPHVMAEVSNLTDLNGPELTLARRFLKETLAILQEPEISSVRASQDENYERLGLVDSAIAVVAREQKCSILTDDLDLYVALSQQGADVQNFTHLRASDWGI